MKKLFKVSLLVTLTAIMAVGCGKTTTSNKKTTTSGSSSNSSTNNNNSNNSGTDSDPTTVEGCNGVYRAGATRCFYSEIIPTLTFSGTGTAAAPQTAVNNVQIWSSRNLPSSVSQNVFRTDATFKVRFKPVYASSGSSQQGRNCSGPMAYNFTRAKVYFMLRRASDSITTIYSTTANVNSYSSRLSLPVSGGTTEPYILEIMGVETDHRCNAAYGTLSTNEKAACSAGTYWGSIPLVTTTSAPTSCMAMNVEFSTDTTYDLP